MILLVFCSLHTHGHPHLRTHDANFPGFPLTSLAGPSQSSLWIPLPLPFMKINLPPDFGSSALFFSSATQTSEIILIHFLAFNHHLYSSDSQIFISSPDSSPEIQTHMSHCLLDFLDVSKALKQYVQN